MKKIITAYFTFIVININAQILNPGFETASDNWSTDFGWGWLVKDTSDSHSGNKAAFLSPAFFCGFANATLVNGTGLPYEIITAGTPVSNKPKRLKGYYKFQNTFPTDSAVAKVFLKKYNTLENKIDTIGMGTTFLSPSNVYTCFYVDIKDLKPGIMPDSIVVFFQVVKDDWMSVNFDSLVSRWSSGSPISYPALYIDDLSLTEKEANFKSAFIHSIQDECNSPSVISFFSNAVSNNCDEINFYEWSFGDIASAHNASAIANPIHTFSGPGEFEVRLIVGNEEMRDTITNTIIVKEINDGAIFIPNAFSPNGDGLNDLFMAKGSTPQRFELKIFNRWGELIFATNDITKGWDGTYKGKILDTEIFVWQMEYISFCNTNETVNRKGFVFLAK